MHHHERSTATRTTPSRGLRLAIGAALAAFVAAGCATPDSEPPELSAETRAYAAGASGSQASATHFEGRVEDSTGRAVRARVTAMWLEEAETLETGSDGRFRFRAPSGEAGGAGAPRLYAQTDDGRVASPRSRPGSREVPVLIVEPGARIDLQLGGADRARFALVRSGETLVEGTLTPGRARSFAVPPGRITARVWHENRAAERTIDVSEGDRATLELTPAR